MSIFFKFGVESGEPHKVTCDGMDMSLLELKLAIKDLRGIKNITDFDLQVKINLNIINIFYIFRYLPLGGEWPEQVCLL